MKIHCFDGGKGGTGKSFTDMACIQLHLDRGIPFKPVEADRYNPDVANRYADLDFQFAVFSEDEQTSTRKEHENPDRLIEMAIEQNVLVSLPAQVGMPLDKWLDTVVAAREEDADLDVQVVRWFVTSGTYESLDLFKKAVKRHGKNMPFVLVKNWKMSQDWSELEEDEVAQKLIHRFNVKVIDLPALEWKESNLLQKKNLTFGEARESNQLQIAQRTRIKAFLKKAYSAFEGTGLV